MSTLKKYLMMATIASTAYLHLTVNSQESVGLGTPVTEDQLSEFDLIAGPDGDGFPAGSGTARQGKAVYDARCAACHALTGEGVSGNTIIVGGDMNSEGTPLRTVGSYWPYASTVFDFVRRAMPADAPKSLSNEEVYQVVAYVLYLNGIVGEDEVLNAETLPNIEMPNADGFIDQSHLL
ncbi:MAG: cytochrome c [Pseudomonadales bacterium]|nr:cytochrome c [Pseudomonadales bacterium]